MYNIDNSDCYVCVESKAVAIQDFLALFGRSIWLKLADDCMHGTTSIKLCM